ncbi:sugar phosphate isomerase/epimerase family protein [Nesterenkonia halotolerans]|uniref:Sugar phosphate isomerase/epimerase n=1 Tax=Nesterenkonia halotolerans TaxID=225325 RepID=A0ABR9J9N7_9MICC|nr:sugar phosphate isomerase/epimerase family protein [Nesterenkonia halotolerans]MBE1515716.1 sugar phosphate isomerase/epimerase [Nesterenkonia halotolerans]
MTWKFSFSTLGMPGAPLDEVIDVATAHGCAGVELRVHADEFLHLDLDGSEARTIGQRIQQAGLEISALAGYARVCSPAPDSEVIDEMASLLTLAEQTSAHAVRVFPGGDAEADAEEHRSRAVRRISAVLPQARECGVQVLVETHDSHATGRAALNLVREIQDPEHVSVLWDGLHPWRHGEASRETREALRSYCSYFQVKDAVLRGDRWVPVIPGSGEVPLSEQGRILQDFSGWISLEWERAWHPHIEPLQDALSAASEWFHAWRPPSLQSPSPAGC